MNDDPKSADDIVIECMLPHSPANVWRAITDQDLLGQWLAPSDLRPEVGARFRLPPSRAVPDAPMIECEVLEAIPGRMLRWRQTERVTENDASPVESLVTFELIPNTAGTHLRISHDHFRRIEAQSLHVVASTALIERRKKRSQTEGTSALEIVRALGTLSRAA